MFWLFRMVGVPALCGAAVRVDNIQSQLRRKTECLFAENISNLDRRSAANPPGPTHPPLLQENLWALPRILCIKCISHRSVVNQTYVP